MAESDIYRKDGTLMIPLTIEGLGTSGIKKDKIMVATDKFFETVQKVVKDAGFKNFQMRINGAEGIVITLDEK